MYIVQTEHHRSSSRQILCRSRRGAAVEQANNPQRCELKHNAIHKKNTAAAKSGAGGVLHHKQATGVSTSFIGKHHFVILKFILCSVR